jgi:hypothetical protein
MRISFVIMLLFLMIFLVFCCNESKSSILEVGGKNIVLNDKEHNIDASTYAGDPEISAVEKNGDGKTSTETAALAINNFLLQYFLTGDYELLEEPLNTNHRNIYFAIHRVQESSRILDVVVGYENVDGTFHRYLLINDFKFISEDDSILYDFSGQYNGIYGFDFSYSYPKVAGYTPGLNITTYFDNGNRVADDFTIRWNENEKRFFK